MTIRNFHTSFFLLFTLLLVGNQANAQADKILSASRSKVSALSTIQVSFRKTFMIRGTDSKPKTYTGKLKMKSTKFWMALQNQELICNGTTLWSINKNDEEVTISKYNPNEGFTPDRIFRLTQDGHKSRYDGIETANGFSCDKISLFPTNKGTDHFKIEVWIDKSKKLPRKMKVWNRSGSVITYDILSLTVNQALSDSYFTFIKSKYPDYYVEDLR